MKYLILFIFITGCTLTTTEITRTYNITIYAAESSTVMFNPDIMADVKKEGEVEVDAESNSDVEAKLPVIP